jgi:hypothetical protein
VGQPLDSWLVAIGAPGWKNTPEETPKTEESKRSAEPSFLELQKEKQVLAQQLDDEIAQRSRAEKAREEAEKEIKAVEEKLAAESQKLKKAVSDYKAAQTAKQEAEVRLKRESGRAKKALEDLEKLGNEKGGTVKELAALKVKLSEETARAKKAEEDAVAAQKKVAEADDALTQIRSEQEKLQEKLKVIETNLRPAMLCFLLYNQTDNPIKFERRSLMRTGEWEEWKKAEIPKNGRGRFQSPAGAISIQVRFETGGARKVVDIDGQVFRGRGRNPSYQDIDCWYGFEETGAGLALKRIPRKQ